MDGETRPPKEEVAALKEDINKIMFGKYLYTAVGCVLAIPIGIKSRSLWPLAIMGSAGTIADITEGYMETEALRARRFTLEKQIEAGSTEKQ